MSESRILSEFAKSGSLHHLSRRFHALTREGKERALESIRNGEDPDKALKRAKRNQ